MSHKVLLVLVYHDRMQYIISQSRMDELVGSDSVSSNSLDVEKIRKNVSIAYSLLVRVCSFPDETFCLRHRRGKVQELICVRSEYDDFKAKRNEDGRNRGDGVFPRKSKEGDGYERTKSIAQRHTT